MFVSKLKLAGLFALLALVLGIGLGRWATNWSEVHAADKPRETPRSNVATAPEEEPRAVRGPLAPRPAGAWERQVGPITTQLRFTGERLTATAEYTEGKMRFKLTLDADYSVTKDYILYGVITGLDIKAEGSDAGDQVELQFMADRLVDCPFSLRYRIDDSVMSLRDVKFGAPFEAGNEVLKDKNLAEYALYLSGRYRPITAEKQRP